MSPRERTGDAVPSVRIRSLVPAEIPELAAIARRCRAADGDDAWLPTHRLAEELPRDPADTLIAQTGEATVGFGTVRRSMTDRGQALLHHDGFVDPAWRERGIGRVLLVALQRRLLEPGPALTEICNEFRTSASEVNAGAGCLLIANGYEPCGTGAVMVRPALDSIPDRTLPAGLTLRPVVPAHFEPIWHAFDAAFRAQPGYAPNAERRAFEAECADPRVDPALWRIAWDHDRVAGMVRSYVDAGENEGLGRRRGYTEGIAVVPGWRGRGVATALLAASLQALRQRGMTEAALTVDLGNPTGAASVYAHLGFVVQSKRIRYRRAVGGDSR